MVRRTVSQTFLILLALALVGVVWSFTIYITYLNYRIGRELVSHRWRTPTEIHSAKTGQLVAKVYGSDWRVTTPVALGDLPDHVPNAFIAAEDVRFRRHPGVDPIGMARALLANLRRRSITQGASTINQQLIKSKFLTYDRTIRRKLVEAILAVLLDFRLSKEDILEAYLNDVYLGHYNGRAVLGIDEASRLFFDKPPTRLTPDEAALIAAVIRAPNRDTPAKNPELARRRRDGVLRVMREQDWITEDEYERARKRSARFRSGKLPEAPFPYYLAALRWEVEDKIGKRAANQTGLKIVCEIDPGKQKEAEEATRRGRANLYRRYSWIRELSADGVLQVALLSIDPGNGGVRALVGGSPYNTLDRTRLMKRQPGSAFKTFAYLAAIESRRFTPATLLLDTPVQIRLSRNEVWEPHNYDERYRGRVTLRQAFEKSLNVPTVRMTDEMGTGDLVRVAHKAGFKEDFPRIPALPLGVTEVTIREMTAAYTTFPNLGERVQPFLLTSVNNAKGRQIYQAKVKRFRVTDPASAYVVHSLLRGVALRGTASRMRRYGLTNVAGKTGTTNDYRDAWFVGYAPNLVTTVWVGFDRGAALRLSSAEAALPIWASYMSKVRTAGTIKPPTGVEFRQIDPQSGYIWAEGCPGPVEEVFLEGTEPKQHCPRGFFGDVVRRVFFDPDTFEEPAAITFDKFRRWTTEVERSRRQMEDRMEKLKRIFRNDNEDEDDEDGG